MAFAVGTLAASAVCLKVVNAGSCRLGPRLVTAARLAKQPRTLAVVACRSTLQGHHPRQATPPRAGPTPSQPPAAILSGRVDVPDISHRAGLPGDRGPAQPPSPVRRRLIPPTASARASTSRNPAKFRRPALQSAGMLRPLPSLSAFSRPTFLFRPMPPGFTTRSTAGSPTPSPPSPRRLGPLPSSSGTAPEPSPSCRHVIEHASSKEYILLPPKNRGGSGRAGLSGPPFPCSESMLDARPQWLTGLPAMSASWPGSTGPALSTLSPARS